MKRFLLVFIALAISFTFIYSNDFADNYFPSINNIFDAYEATVIVKRVTQADSVMGTGFFVSEDYLVTNASTVGTSQMVKVNIRDNDYNAYVIAVHYFLDFALLKIDGYTSFRTFTFERYDANMFDNRGTILNYPDDRIEETTGAILTNSTIYDNEALFQMDISMPRGRVDGPILNTENRLIGFLMSNNLTRDYIDSKQFIPNSVYLAVKSDYLIPIIQIYTKIAIHYKTPNGDITGLTPDPGIILASTPDRSNTSPRLPDRPIISSGVYQSQPSSISIDEIIPRSQTILTTLEGIAEPKGGGDKIINPPDIGDGDIPDNEKIRRERAEKERAEREKIARERVQNQKIQQANDERNRQDRLQAERQQAERDRLQKEQNAVREQQDRDRVEREQAEINRINKERTAREQAEKERLQREQAAEKERLERERLQSNERARSQRELEAENERLSRERTAREQAAERERAAQQQIQAAERERQEKARIQQQEQAEKEKRQNELNLQNNTQNNNTRRP